jgi:uncharacterized protein (TIGR02145 family)
MKTLFELLPHCPGIIRASVLFILMTILWQCTDEMPMAENEQAAADQIVNQKKLKDKTGLTVTSLPATDVSISSAMVSGEVASHKDFEVTARGIYWSTSANPDTTATELSFGSGNGSFSGELSGLAPATTYFFRAYAINKKGILLGEILSFTTLSSPWGLFTDPRDGQTYATIKIGNQTWLAENLNFDSGPGRSCYGNDPQNCETYGSLYTWEAALNAVPEGWHMPSRGEYETLINYFSNPSEAYDGLREGGSSGFDSKFAGFLNINGNYEYKDQYGDYWTITEEIGGAGWVWIMDLNIVGQTATIGADRKDRGFSLRCVQGPAEPGLVAYYPFAFGSARDQSGYYNHGQIYGGLAATSDRHGHSETAVAFNGTDSFIEVPNSASLQSPQSALTITAWVQLSGSQPVAAGFVTKTNTSDYGQYHLNYQNWNGPNIFFMAGDDGLSSNTFLSPGTWYFIASTYDGEYMKTYVNGSLAAIRPAGPPMQPDSYPLMIGIDTPGSVEYLDGVIDEIRVYNRALTETEVNVLYNQ